ncbi:MAG TPA: cadherin-like domain-containing protein [Balneolales bacterium]|nr:cadherin-like domain-containing protein [Balneolales bacterium]
MSRHLQAVFYAVLLVCLLLPGILLPVFAQDSLTGMPLQQGSTGVHIQLSNMSIPESILPGHLVGRIIITETAQTTTGSQWHYMLMDDGQGHFSLDDSLLVTADSAHFDYETKKSYSVTIRVFNDQGESAEQSFTIAIRNVNEPPEHISLSNTRIAENSPAGTPIGALSAVDPDSADHVHFAMIGDSANARYQIEKDRLEIKEASYFDYEKHHKVSLTIRAIDTHGAYKDSTFTISLINEDDPPTAVSLVPGRVKENSPNGTLVGRLYTTDEDSADAFKYSLIDDADGRFALSGNNDAIVTADSTRLDYEAHHTFTLRLRSTDKGGKSVTDTVLVRLVNVNEPPIITGLYPVQTREDTPADTLWFQVSDPESKPNKLSASVSSLNTSVFADSGLTIGGKGSQRWIVARPLPDSNGVGKIQVAVSDGQLVTNQLVDIRVIPVNDPPRLVHNGLLKLDEGTSKTLTSAVLSYFDVDNTPSQLRYQIIRLPQHGQIYRDSTRLYQHDTFTQEDINKRRISYTHDGSETTKDQFTLSLTDGSGAHINNIVNHIKIHPVNDPPVLSQLPQVETLEDHLSPVVSFTVSDAETPASDLNLKAISSNQSLLPDSSIKITGVAHYRNITMMPAHNQNGTANVTVMLSDGTTYVTRTFRFTVIPVNDPPVLSDIGARQLNEDDTLKVKFDVSDVDNATSDLKTWVASEDESLIPKSGLNVVGNGNQRKLIIIPKPDQSGKANLVLYASDGDTTISEPFKVTVKPVNDPPEKFALYNPNIYVDVDTLAITFQWEEAQDPEHDPITYSLHIQGEKVDTTISDIGTTHYLFTQKHLLQANSVYKWWVDASDGHSSVSCYIQQEFTAPKVPLPPRKYELFSNYPNPFNPTTRIKYQIPVTSHVSLAVYDLLGRKVADLVDKQQSAGEYQVSWNASDRASGIYIYQLIALGVDHSRYIQTKKMLLVK